MRNSEDEPAAPPSVQADEWFAALRRREDELRRQGLSRAVAMYTAEVEDRIATQWPPDWSDDFQALVYGDFDASPAPWEYPQLGVRIRSANLRDTVIRGALGVYAARVKVTDRSFHCVMDAAARLNTLIGILSAVDWWA